MSASKARDQGMTAEFALGLWKEEDTGTKASVIHLSETISDFMTPDPQN
jgi:hypothetical protein